MGSVSPVVLGKLRPSGRLPEVPSLYVAHGAGEILSSPNAKLTSINVNVRQGMNLQWMTYSAGTCLCARFSSRWRPGSLSLKESRVTYFAITGVCHWIGMCTVNGWQLIHYKFTIKFIPVNQFPLFMCSYPERALSVSCQRILSCTVMAKAALLPSEHKCPGKNKLGTGSDAAI